MTDDELVACATEFREGLLEGEPSYRMCFVVAAPLEGLLRFYGIDVALVKGAFGETGEFLHFWIELSDGRVLDPTADQFNEHGFGPFPEIYLGEPTEIHKKWKS